MIDPEIVLTHRNPNNMIPSYSWENIIIKGFFTKTPFCIVAEKKVIIFNLPYDIYFHTLASVFVFKIHLYTMDTTSNVYTK